MAGVRRKLGVAMFMDDSSRDMAVDSSSGISGDAIVAVGCSCVVVYGTIPNISPISSLFSYLSSPILISPSYPYLGCILPSACYLHHSSMDSPH